jgi:hypothetical protein
MTCESRKKERKKGKFLCWACFECPPVRSYSLVTDTRVSSPPHRRTVGSLLETLTDIHICTVCTPVMCLPTEIVWVPSLGIYFSFLWPCWRDFLMSLWFTQVVSVDREKLRKRSLMVLELLPASWIVLKFSFFRGSTRRSPPCLLKGLPSFKCLLGLSSTLHQLQQRLINTLWQMFKGYWQPFEKFVLFCKGLSISS